MELIPEVLQPMDKIKETAGSNVIVCPKCNSPYMSVAQIGKERDVTHIMIICAKCLNILSEKEEDLINYLKILESDINADIPEHIIEKLEDENYLIVSRRDGRRYLTRKAIDKLREETVVVEEPKEEEPEEKEIVEIEEKEEPEKEVEIEEKPKRKRKRGRPRKTIQTDDEDPMI